MTKSEPTTSELSASVTINASPAQVWALICDLPRMSEFSPQVVRTVMLGRARKGARFFNLNTKNHRLFWPTSGKIVRFTPHSDFAFRITENRAIWSFQLQPTADGGTLVTHRRETPEGISVLSKGLTTVALGGQAPFTAELLDGMNRTLERIKAAAER